MWKLEEALHDQTALLKAVLENHPELERDDDDFVTLRDSTEKASELLKEMG